MLGVAATLCNERYASHKHPCHGCPIHEQCTSSHTAQTWASLEEWQTRCNDAAERYHGEAQQ